MITAEGTTQGTLIGDETGDYISLEPNYPQLLRWFINAIATGSYEGHDNIRVALRSVVDITRWLAVTDREELQKILKEMDNG